MTIFIGPPSWLTPTIEAVIAFATVMFVLGGFAITAMWIARKYPFDPSAKREADLNQDIIDLKKQIGTLLDDRMEDRDKVTELQKDLNSTRTELLVATNLLNSTRLELSTTQADLANTKTELVRANGRIRELEQKLAKVKPGRIVGKSDEGALNPDLLLVLGPDPAINEREENALLGSKMEFRICRAADKKGAFFDDFKGELNRYRDVMGKPPKFIVFGMHGGQGNSDKRGYLSFRDRDVDFTELTAILDGVQVVMLSACGSTALGDMLFPTVPVVIDFTEDVDNVAAGRFDVHFWSEMSKNSGPQKSFVRARDRVPEIKNMIFIHMDCDSKP